MHLSFQVNLAFKDTEVVDCLQRLSKTCFGLTQVSYVELCDIDKIFSILSGILSIMIMCDKCVFDWFRTADSQSFSYFSYSVCWSVDSSDTIEPFH